MADEEVTTLLWSKKLPVSKRGPDKPASEIMPAFWAFETNHGVYYHRVFITLGSARQWISDHLVTGGEGVPSMDWVAHTEPDRQRHLEKLNAYEAITGVFYNPLSERNERFVPEYTGGRLLRCPVCRRGMRHGAETWVCGESHDLGASIVVVVKSNLPVKGVTA